MEEQFIHAMTVINETEKTKRPSRFSVASVTGKMDLELFSEVTDIRGDVAKEMFTRLDNNRDSLLGLNEWLNAIWHPDMIGPLLESMGDHHRRRKDTNTIDTTPLLVSVPPPPVHH